MPDWERAFAATVEVLKDVPIMTPEQGRRIWSHFAQVRPKRVLDIGTAFGCSTAYMAAAVKHFGGGTVVTVDSGQFDDRSPALASSKIVYERCGVSDIVEIVRTEHSDYAWWLLEEWRRKQTDPTKPDFDFVYLDGNKTFPLNAAAVVLIEQLLAPSGWLLMDDLNWTYQAHPEHVPVTVHASGETYEMSPAQSAQPQLLAVFNAVVQTSPRLGNCRVELNGAWGWAQRINTAAARHGTTKRGRRWRPTKAKS